MVHLTTSNLGLDQLTLAIGGLNTERRVVGILLNRKRTVTGGKTLVIELPRPRHFDKPNAPSSTHCTSGDPQTQVGFRPLISLCDIPSQRRCVTSPLARSPKTGVRTRFRRDRPPCRRFPVETVRDIFCEACEWPP